MIWSLEGELCKLASTEALDDALVKLGLLNSVEDQFKLDAGNSSWRRVGAETYVFEFDVAKADSSHRYVIKACVAYGHPSVEGILHSWIERRQLLESNGVSTPRLYGWGHGILLEEFIPYELPIILAQKPVQSILQCLATTYGVVARLGFVPIELFAGLRSRGTDVVIIDFGEDLGPAGMTNTTSQNPFERLMLDLAANGVEITASDHDLMWVAFCRATEIRLQ